MRRMSSPGMYARCSAKSIDAPRCGERCRPLMTPSTTVRATISRFPMRASTTGSTSVAPGTRVPEAVSTLHPRPRHRDDLQQLLDDLIRRHALRLGGKVREHAVAQHWLGQRADVREA